METGDRNLLFFKADRGLIRLFQKPKRTALALQEISKASCHFGSPSLYQWLRNFMPAGAVLVLSRGCGVKERYEMMGRDRVRTCDFCHVKTALYR